MSFFTTFKAHRTVWRALVPGLLLLIGLRLAYALIAFPNPDEAYYWLWGQQLDWSYYDHPPLHGWIQGAVAALLGSGAGVLRLPTAVSSGLFLHTYVRVCQYLYGSQGPLAFGVLLGVLLASPLYFIYMAMAWQDQWLVVFSLLGAFGLVNFLEGHGAGQPRYGQLYRAAVWLGLAGLCKYTAVFVGVAGLGVIVTQSRSLLKQGPLYGAIAIALLCQLPVLLWNRQNNWLSVTYYLTRSVDSGPDGFSLKPLEVLGFWGFCGLILSPAITWALWRCCRSPILTHCPRLYRAMALWLFGVSTGGLSAVALFSTALHYWNILAYLLLLPLLPAFFLQQGKPQTAYSTRLTAIPASRPPALSLTGQWQHRRGFHIMQGLGILAAGAILFNGAILPLAALAGPDGDHESRILYGWDQVAQTVQTQLASLPSDTLLLTTDYRSAALLGYQLRQTHLTPSVLAISQRRDQFDIWATRRPTADKPALILADDWHPLTTTWANQFKQLSPPTTLTIEHRGYPIKTYRLYSSSSFQPPSSELP
ncbi:MAG: glycosyltransferase family 39 protein [Cyanobacteria bacterium P01_A01_bin.105]